MQASHSVTNFKIHIDNLLESEEFVFKTSINWRKLCIFEELGVVAYKVSKLFLKNLRTLFSAKKKKGGDRN